MVLETLVRVLGAIEVISKATVVIISRYPIQTLFVFLILIFLNLRSISRSNSNSTGNGSSKSVNDNNYESDDPYRPMSEDEWRKYERKMKKIDERWDEFVEREGREPGFFERW